MTVILHIRKTGGSALGDALAPVAASLGVDLPGHEVRLQDVAEGRRVIFTVRDPISRFCSGFNSRLRCGRPRNNRPWTDGEARAFSRFPTPSALAEALGGADPEVVADAHAALQAIPHLRPLSFWLGDAEALRARSDDIAMVLWQPELDADFEQLKRLLALPSTLLLPRDDGGSHRTPSGFSTRVTAEGRAALHHHYAEDFQLYDICLDMRAARARGASGR